MFNQINIERFKFSLFGSESPFAEQVDYIDHSGEEPVTHTLAAQVTRNPLRIVDGQAENDIWVELSAADLSTLNIIPKRGKDQIELQPNIHDPAKKRYTIQRVIDQDVTSITLGLNR